MSQIARNFGLIAMAGAAAFAITAVGQGLWGVMVMANVRLTPSLAWAAVVMPIVLAALAAFLARRGWPHRGAAARRALVPLASVSAAAWTWSLLAGVAGVIAVASLWTVMASVVRVPPNVLPDARGLPLTTLIPILVVSVIAAPLTEEIAFRGYAMGLLRRRFPPATALVITSLLFAAAHLTQGLFAPKLLVYFLAGLLFGLIALRTGSLIPAMVTHSLADLTFFTLVWPRDAGRRLISHGGAGPWFYADLAMVVIFAGLCILALARLALATKSGPSQERGDPGRDAGERGPRSEFAWRSPHRRTSVTR
jgi:membrane protease YdiL (CAAX protease family)